MTAAQDRSSRAPFEDGAGVRRPLAGSPQRLSEERRRVRRQGISLALVLILLGAAGAVYVSAQGQARVDVVALAHPVQRGQIVTAADLATVQVGVDGGQVRLSTPAGAARDIVGRAALLDLPRGQLLSPELVAASTPVLEGSVAVGVRLTRDALPAQTLRPGEWVSVVRTSSDGDAREVAGRAMVLSFTSSSSTGGAGSDGDAVVHLAVPGESVDAVAGAASVNGGLRLVGIRP